MIPTELNGVPVRLYLPEPGRNTPLPVILYLHGGGWVIGNLNTCAKFAGLLAKKSGMIVISVDYRLAPEHPAPAAGNDVTAVLTACRKPLLLPTGWQNDPEQIFLAGDSAGATLAAAAALDEHQKSGRSPSGVLLFYPVTDMNANESESMHDFARGFAMDRDVLLSFYHAYQPDQQQWQKPEFSILNADLSAFPPALIVTCQLDILRDQGRSLAQKLKQLQRQLDYREYQGATHIFITVPGLQRYFNQALNDAVDFLKKNQSR